MDLPNLRSIAAVSYVLSAFLYEYLVPITRNTCIGNGPGKQRPFLLCEFHSSLIFQFHSSWPHSSELLCCDGAFSSPLPPDTFKRECNEKKYSARTVARSEKATLLD